MVARLVLPVLISLGFALALLSPSPAMAQFPDLLELSAQYLPGAELDDPPGGDVQLSAYDAVLNIPVVLDDRTFLVPGVQYHVDSASFQGQGAEFIQLRAFHAISVPVLFVRLLPKDWSWSLRVAPALAGDFARIDAGAFHVSAVTMATKGVSDRLVLGFGAMATYSFGSLLPLPALYLDWTPLPWFRVETFVPGFAHIDFRVGDRFEVGPGLYVAGNEYAIRDERIRSSAACTGPRASRTDCLDHIAYSEVTAGLDTRVGLFSTWWLSMRVGHTVFRRFEQFDAANERLTGGLQTLPGTWFVRAALTWRIPMGDDEG